MKSITKIITVLLFVFILFGQGEVAEAVRGEDEAPVDTPFKIIQAIDSTDPKGSQKVVDNYGGDQTKDGSFTLKGTVIVNDLVRALLIQENVSVSPTYREIEAWKNAAKKFSSDDEGYVLEVLKQTLLQELDNIKLFEIGNSKVRIESFSIEQFILVQNTERDASIFDGIAYVFTTIKINYYIPVLDKGEYHTIEFEILGSSTTGSDLKKPQVYVEDNNETSCNEYIPEHEGSEYRGGLVWDGRTIEEYAQYLDETFDGNSEDKGEFCIAKLGDFVRNTESNSSSNGNGNSSGNGSGTPGVAPGVDPVATTPLAEYTVATILQDINVLRKQISDLKYPAPEGTIASLSFSAPICTADFPTSLCSNDLTTNRANTLRWNSAGIDSTTEGTLTLTSTNGGTETITQRLPNMNAYSFVLTQPVGTYKVKITFGNLSAEQLVHVKKGGAVNESLYIDNLKEGLRDLQEEKLRLTPAATSSTLTPGQQFNPVPMISSPGAAPVVSPAPTTPPTPTKICQVIDLAAIIQRTAANYSSGVIPYKTVDCDSSEYKNTKSSLKKEIISLNTPASMSLASASTVYVSSITDTLREIVKGVDGLISRGIITHSN